jgi:hypothetical protein
MFYKKGEEMKRELFKPGTCAVCGGDTSPIDFEKEEIYVFEVEECRDCQAINFYQYRRDALDRWNEDHDTWPVPMAIGIEFIERIHAPGKLPYWITRSRVLPIGVLIDEEENES